MAPTDSERPQIGEKGFSESVGQNRSSMNTKGDPLTYAVIGEAMATHRALGPGLDEEFYHQDLSKRLRNKGIEHLSKPRRDLIYLDQVADTFEPDLVVAGKLIVELKALRKGFAPEHLAQALGYLKFWRLRTGLLLDFGKASLVQKRLAYDSKAGKFATQPLPEFVKDTELVERIVSSLDQCLARIGLGYRENTWTGLVRAALLADGLRLTIDPSSAVGHGTADFRCLVVEDTCAPQITALGDDMAATDRARVQTCLRWLKLPFGIAVHFGKDTAEYRCLAPPTEDQSIQTKDSV